MSHFLNDTDQSNVTPHRARSVCDGREVARFESKWRQAMTKLVDETKYDLSYLKSHTLQPKWFKILKVFILLGVLIGCYYLFGLNATILFCVTFFFLMLMVHLAYRIKTNKYTTSWLDFVVIQEGEEIKTKRIGKYYYSAVIVSAIIALIVSQVLT